MPRPGGSGRMASCRSGGADCLVGILFISTPMIWAKVKDIFGTNMRGPIWFAGIYDHSPPFTRSYPVVYITLYMSVSHRY